MTDIIKNWLTEILDVPSDTKSESFIRNIQNGSLIAQVLHALSIIDEEQLKTITNATEPQTAFSHICTWLKDLGLPIKSETREDLTKGKLSTIIRLFYQLYLTLKPPGAKKQSRVKCDDDILKAPPPVKDFADHIIKWQKTRYSGLLERCEKAAEDYKRYTKKLADRPKTNRTSSADVDDLKKLNLLQSDYGSKYTYNELLEEQNKAKAIRVEEPDPKVSRRIVRKIQNRNRQAKQRTRLQTQMEKVLLDEVWKTIHEKYVRNAELATTKRLLQQSSFEKQIAIKQMQAREEHNAILEIKKTMEQDVKSKRNEELIQQIFSMGDKTNAEKHQLRYYFERDLLLNLHRKIYAEKLRKKAERAHEMCNQVLKDLVDLALIQAEFLEEHGEEMSYSLKTELFVTRQQILDPVVEPAVVEEAPPEEIVQVETDIDGKNFEAYLNFQRPWEATDFTQSDGILGHIVFRLLRAKYPEPPPPPGPDLPKYKIAVCVSNITEPEVLGFLEKLLADRKVKVIRMEDAVDFCRKSYELEMAPEIQAETKKESDTKSKDNVMGNTLGEKSKASREPATKTKGKGRELTEKPISQEQDKFQEKQTQTPKIYPCEEIRLSPKAELGRLVGVQGELLPDDLLSKIFIEYLKSLKNVEGWVLVNYPQNFDQAASLEGTLTGRPVPPITTSADQNKTSSNQGQCECCNCPHETKHPKANKQDLRASKLLTDPDPPPLDGAYKSYLTAYVKLVQLSPSVESLPRLPDMEGDDVHLFYQNQGSLYTLYYKTFDFLTVKHLAKLIVGDYSIPPKTSVQIFGDTIHQVETEFPDEKQKAAKPKKEKKARKDGAKLPEVVITREDKATQAPEVKSDVEGVEPPDVRWRYVDLEIPRVFEVALATLWENMEEVYLTDFKDAFSNVRMLRRAYAAYLNHVKQNVEEFIARPGNQQTDLQEFLSVFNQFDQEMRGDWVVKAELLCRVYQFREKMWELCDERLRMNEELRRLIAEEDWLVKQTCELTNAYIYQFQLELDRCVDTLRLLNDYYVVMMTKMPGQEDLDKKILSYVHFANEGGCSTIYTHFFKQLLLNASSGTSPFLALLDENFDFCLALVNQYQTTSLSVLDKIGEPSMFSELSKDVKKVGPKLIEEWRCALNGEVTRIKLRLNQLKSRAILDLQDIMDHVLGTFAEIRSDIAGSYRKEVEGVQDMHDAFSRAIAAQEPMSPSFEDDVHPSIEKRPYSLSIDQLNKLVDLFTKAAPSGMISTRAFTYIMQDLIAQDDEEGATLPPTWRLMTPNQVNQLSEKFFGKSEKLDWKDFIVYNMGVDFPSEEQLLETRGQFRKYDASSRESVHTREYDDVKFWFENGDCRSSQVKELLHRLFKLDEEAVNYTSLLLLFCKDEDVVAGVAKALALAIGKRVCWQWDLGEAFKDSIRRRRELESEDRIRREIEHLEAGEDADVIMDGLIDRAVHQCDSCFLEEITSVLMEENENNGGEEEWKNVEVGFEANPNPPKVYYLPFGALPAIFEGVKAQSTIAMGFMEKLEMVYGRYKNPKHNGLVLAHEFLNSEDFLELLKDSCKFIVRKPSVIIEKLINGV